MTDSEFVRELQGAMQQYTAMRQQGVSREDACAGLEAVLREMWPKKPTKFPPQCERCDDTSWALHTCWHEQRCPRHAGMDCHPGYEHTYVTRCTCPKGDKFRARAPQADEAIAAVGKVQPKRGGFSWSGTIRGRGVADERGLLGS